MLPTTTSMLLTALLDEETSSRDGTWTEFDGRYRPVLFAFARRLGLTDEDAAEVAQDALVRFVEEFRAGKYDRERGRLRSWLFAITRGRYQRLRRNRARAAAALGNTALEELPGEDQLAELFEDEWRRAILREGLRRLEESRIDKTTLAVFQAVTLDAREVAEVAAEYGMSANAVYLAKFRCLERLRGVLSLVEGEWV